ncbi:MAG: NVEALA domain-containing protein [Odoribacter sp.]|nr:NVEALA domain-containing protein [Odoribacter sp.]
MGFATFVFGVAACVSYSSISKTKNMLPLLLVQNIEALAQNEGRGESGEKL